MGYSLNFAAVWRSFDQLLEGLLLSLGLAFVSILIGALIGLLLAFALISKSAWTKAPAAAYVTVIRNLPILVLVLFAYSRFRSSASGLARSKASWPCSPSIPALTSPKCFAPACYRSRVD